MQKLSYYTVISDRVAGDEVSGSNIVYSTRSGISMILNNTILQSIQQNNFNSISDHVIAELTKAQILVDESENELVSIIEENNESNRNNTLLYHVIQPSANCQLGCDYCGQVHTKKGISQTHSDSVIRRIEEKLTSGHKYGGLYIGWFGSEPLMGLQGMRDMTPKLKALADRHGLGYGAKITTNGLSLKENIFLELVNKMSVQGIEITLDGTAKYHDQRRYTKEKVETFDIIFNNLLSILNRDDFKSLKCNISIRCNVDYRNMDGVVPLINLLAENNLQDKISFYLAPIHSWGNDAHQKSLTHEEFANYEIDWYIEMMKLGFQPNIIPTRKKKLCLVTEKEGELFDAYGGIYNCTEVSYVPTYEPTTSYLLGNLSFNSATYSQKRPFANWNDDIKNGNTNSPCTSCKMLPVCGGGCPKLWSEGLVACPSAKFNIQDRLILSYVQTKKGVRELSFE